MTTQRAWRSLLSSAAILLCLQCTFASRQMIRQNTPTRHSRVAHWHRDHEIQLALAGDGRGQRWLLETQEELPNDGPLGRLKAQKVAALERSAEARREQTSSGTHRALQENQVEQVTVAIDVGTGHYKINPWIFGVNDQNPNWADLKAAGIQMVRKGGDAESRFNWELDMTNRAGDLYFESLPNVWGPGPPSFDTFVQSSNANQMSTLATIPVLGWLPKSKTIGCSFSVSKYGPQKQFDSNNRDCGNGILLDGSNVKNDPNDVSMPTDASLQKAFVQSNVQKYGAAKDGGVKLYSMDNEPVWWSSMHWDIHPEASGYDEVVQRTLTYAPAVKAADPGALILGPVAGGWTDTFYSRTDMNAGYGKAPYQWWSNPVDRMAHGNKPFVQYYLEQMEAYRNAHGVRLVDMVDIHAYVIGFNDNTDPKSQKERIEAVRIMWDPKYKCTTCGFMDPVTAPTGIPKFIPRVKSIIDSTAPGVGLAITEYNLGGGKDISGAIAQAELLGVFAEQKVSLATFFPSVDASSSIYWAFRMFGNYDGQFSSFGSLGVRARSNKRRKVSAYAAINKKTSKLTVLINNLEPHDANVALTITGLNLQGTTRVFRYSAGNLQAIVQLPAVSSSSINSLTYPGYTLTMLEIPM